MSNAVISRSMRLVFKTGKNQDRAQKVVVKKDRIVIGSVASADLRLSGPGVSPIHAVIEKSEGTYQIFDLASETGVFVNGEKTVSRTLTMGDQIKIASVVITFEENKKEELTSQEKENIAALLLEREEEVEDIFDYSATEKKALEVVLSWRGVILDVEHFTTQVRVLVGSEKGCDFSIPPLLDKGRFPLASRQGAEWRVRLDSRMQGVLQRQGRVLSLDEVRKEAGGSLSELTIAGNSFLKLSIGELDFYISFTAAPPRIKKRRMFLRDPFFSRIMLTSAALSGLLLFSLLNLKGNQSMEIEEVPERIATILYQPEKYQTNVVPKPKPPEPKKPEPKVEEKKPEPVVKKPEPKKEIVKVDLKPTLKTPPKVVPKEFNVSKPKPVQNKPAKAAAVAKTKAQSGQNKGNEGEGARAKGAEGRRGTKTAPKAAAAQSKAQRPSATAGTGPGGEQSQVAGQGNVQALKGAESRIDNLLGGLSEKLGKSGSKLEGFSGFDTQGVGGLGVSGKGKGGGGKVESMGGLGDKGQGGGRVGTGLGAAGNGSSIIGGKSRVAIRSGGPEEAVVMGSIDSSAVEAALLAHKDEFRLCYEREINASTPRLAGRVGTTFVIGPTGRVTQAGISSSSLKNASAERCIVGVIKRIDFPVPVGGTLVQVNYPFKFNPVGQ